MDRVVIGLLAVGLLAIMVGSSIRPYVALRVLLVLLPLHSGVVLFLANVAGMRGVSFTMSSAWKEAVIIGIAFAALAVAKNRWRSLRVVHWISVALIALIAARATVELVMTPENATQILFGARQLGEFLLVMLAVSLLRPSVGWFRRTAMFALPVIMLCTLFAIAQPSLGGWFYDEFFHAPGERLHHSYLITVGEMRRFRAVGTFIAPNELGLGLVIYGSIFVLPLLAATRRWRTVAAAGMLMVIALVLSFSRSAWVGAFVGVIATGALFHRHILRLWRAGMLIRLPLREVLVGVGTAAVGTAVVFVAVGGLTLFIGTISGTESSAAGRGESIGGGLEATFENIGGLGLGTAGPRALELTGSAVLTENWYLLYSIQLGVVALPILVAFAISAVVTVASEVRANLLGFGPPFRDWIARRYQAAVMLGTLAALIAGLLGALVIPAMLDLPSSIALWSAVGIVIGWGVEGRSNGAEPAGG